MCISFSLFSLKFTQVLVFSLKEWDLLEKHRFLQGKGQIRNLFENSKGIFDKNKEIKENTQV